MRLVVWVDGRADMTNELAFDRYLRRKRSGCVRRLEPSPHSQPLCVAPCAAPLCSCENAEPPCTDRLAPPSSRVCFHSSTATHEPSVVAAHEGVGRARDGSSCFLESRGALPPSALARSLAARAALLGRAAFAARSAQAGFGAAAPTPSPSPSPPPSPAAARAPYAVERGAESAEPEARGSAERAGLDA